VAVYTEIGESLKWDWLAERSDELDVGDIPALLSAARELPLAGVKAEQRETARGYLENNAPRMRCQHFRSPGMFVGSGAVEVGCKAVIGQRLKLSGMHWTCNGATGILTLRCQQASGRWKESGGRPIDQERPDRLLTTVHTQTTQASTGYPPVTYILVPHPIRRAAHRFCR